MNTEKKIIELKNKSKSPQELYQVIMSESPEIRKDIAEYIKKINSTVDVENVYYHGTDHKLADKIYKEGFELIQGHRSGFLGASETVVPKGIFFTKSIKLAHFFADNRSEAGRGEIIEVEVNLQKTLDLRNAKNLSKESKLLAFDLMKKWDGVDRKNIPQSFAWWLLDKNEFVDQLKSEGYDSAIFAETKNVRSLAGADKNDFTYFVMDMNNIKVSDYIKTIQDLYNYIERNLK